MKGYEVIIKHLRNGIISRSELDSLENGIRQMEKIVAKLGKGEQCNGCNEYKDGKCKRIANDGEVGICWMELSEDEY